MHPRHERLDEGDGLVEHPEGRKAPAPQAAHEARGAHGLPTEHTRGVPVRSRNSSTISTKIPLTVD